MPVMPDNENDVRMQNVLPVYEKLKKDYKRLTYQYWFVVACILISTAVNVYANFFRFNELPARFFCASHNNVATASEDGNTFTCNDGSAYQIRLETVRAAYTGE